MIGPTDPRCPSCGAAVVAEPPTAPPSWTNGPSTTSFGGPPTTETAAPRPVTAPADPWAIPPPGAEWGVPHDPNQPTFQTPAQPYAYGQQTVTRDAGSAYSIAGIVCGAIAFVFCPLGLGIVGLVLAGKAKSRGEDLAGVARIVSMLGLVGGIAIGALVYTRLNTGL